jgi:hypothetical protein
MKRFREYNKDFEEFMEDLWVDEQRWVKKGEQLIYAHHLKKPYRMLSTMIC